MLLIANAPNREPRVRIVDDAGIRRAVLEDTERDGEARQTQRVVVRAVQWIHDPDEVAVEAGRGFAFLREDAVTREPDSYRLEYARLQRGVHRGHAFSGALPGKFHAIRRGHGMTPGLARERQRQRDSRIVRLCLRAHGVRHRRQQTGYSPRASCARNSVSRPSSASTTSRTLVAMSDRIMSLGKTIWMPVHGWSTGSPIRAARCT